MNKPFTFKIGADPEFIIMCGIKMAAADRTIPLLVKNNKSCVKKDMGYNVEKHGNIGWDGSSSTGEIRPAPSEKLDEIVNNIHQLFAATTKDINIFKMSTLSMRKPVGGHIHLELPSKIIGDRTAEAKISKALSSFYLPLMLGENMVSLNMRWSKSSSYGSLIDYRCDNSKTIEYRCPSAEWLTTPKVAKATLAYFGVVYNEIIKDPGAFCKKYKDVMWRTKDQATAIQSLILSGSGSMIKQLFDKINRHVKEFELYNEYKNEIKFITSPNAVINEKKKHDYDIISGWGLKGKKPSKRTLINQKKLDEKTKDINLEELNELVPINHNGDFNTEVFANEIKKRIIALNWNPSKKYFLFGLRKGVNDYLIFDKAGQIYTGKQLIKTTEDSKMVNELFWKMDAKFRTEGPVATKEDQLTKYIMVGIPYEARQRNDFKEFIKIIVDLESDKIKGEKINGDALAKTLVGQNKEEIKLTLPKDLLASRTEADSIMETEEQAIDNNARVEERLNAITAEQNNEDN